MLYWNALSGVYSTATSGSEDPAGAVVVVVVAVSALVLGAALVVVAALVTGAARLVEAGVPGIFLEAVVEAVVSAGTVAMIAASVCPGVTSVPEVTTVASSGASGGSFSRCAAEVFGASSALPVGAVDSTVMALFSGVIPPADAMFSAAPLSASAETTGVDSTSGGSECRELPRIIVPTAAAAITAVEITTPTGAREADFRPSWREESARENSSALRNLSSGRNAHALQMTFPSSVEMPQGRGISLPENLSS